MNKIQSMAPKEFAKAVLQEVGKKMFDLDEVIHFCLVALYTNGHVLLEGNPGLGKTELVKTLGQVLQLDAKRIQFTPDLMPSDVTGTYMPDISGNAANMQALKFHHGPVFPSLLLADEINRATPKTQSAMLEAMAERQVTVLGERHELPQPFFVLATQNPIDHEGTYDLPEAQLDRFMFKIDVSAPGLKALRSIMEKETESHEIKITPVNAEDPVQAYKRLSRSIKGVEPREAVQQHVCNVVQASNQRFSDLASLGRGQDSRIRSMVGHFRYGLGPRAAIALMNGAKAWSLLFSEEMDKKTHTQSLARVALPALRHRVKLKYGWEQEYQRNKPYRWGDGDQEIDLPERMLADFCLATAPTQDGYYKEVEGVFQRYFTSKKR
jgi:MoxR-like ATPase